MTVYMKTVVMVVTSLPVRVDICIHSSTASEGHVDCAELDYYDGILI